MRNRTLYILILIALIAILNPMNTLNASDMSDPPHKPSRTTNISAPDIRGLSIEMALSELRQADLSVTIPSIVGLSRSEAGAWLEQHGFSMVKESVK
ncbi:MAG: hypothetical protein ACOYEQ_02525 [Bacillota bacterium]|jgi:hypothetical protein